MEKSRECEGMCCCRRKLLSLLTDVQQIGEDAFDVYAILASMLALVITGSTTDCTIRARLKRRFYPEATLVLPLSGTHVAELFQMNVRGYC